MGQRVRDCCSYVPEIYSASGWALIARDVKSVNRDNPAGHAKDILFGFC